MITVDALTLLHVLVTALDAQTGGERRRGGGTATHVPRLATVHRLAVGVLQGSVGVLEAATYSRSVTSNMKGFRSAPHVVNRLGSTVDVISAASDSLVAGLIDLRSSPPDVAAFADGIHLIVMRGGAPCVIQTSDDTMVATMTGSGDQRVVDSVGSRASVSGLAKRLDE